MTKLITYYETRIQGVTCDTYAKTSKIYRINYLVNSLKEWGVSEENIAYVQRHFEEGTLDYSKFQGLISNADNTSTEEIIYTIIKKREAPFTKVFKMYDVAFQKANWLGVPMITLGAGDHEVYLVTQAQSKYDRIEISDCNGHHAHVTQSTEYGMIPEVAYLDWQVPNHLKSDEAVSIKEGQAGA